MPAAAPFVIHSFDAVYTASGDVERITAVAFDCGRCQRESLLRGDALTHLPGGCLIRCSHCGGHQALSNTRIAAETLSLSPAPTVSTERSLLPVFMHARAMDMVLPVT